MSLIYAPHNLPFFSDFKIYHKILRKIIQQVSNNTVIPIDYRPSVLYSALRFRDCLEIFRHNEHRILETQNQITRI